jgi:hypothetical protein
VRVAYFISGSFDYNLVIWPGVGKPFAEALAWEALSLAQMAEADFDVAVIDARFQVADIPYIEGYLSRPVARRRPVFFNTVDPEDPLRENPALRYAFGQANRSGVHYATTYEPAGPLLEFFGSLSTSVLAPLPFPYDTRREIDVPMQGRERKVLLTGEQWRRVYPLRHKALKTWKWNPFGRLAMDVLRHPGYPDAGAKPRHNITHDKFVAKLSGYTHAFMCPSVFDVELMKYVECAYAGCVPIGTAPRSISKDVRDCFVDWRGGGLALFLATRIGEAEAQQRASSYRAALKRLRDPQHVVAMFEDVARRVV